MRIIVLGAAAGGGFPQWNCRCATCRQAWGGAVAAQSQASLAVSADDEHWLLLNASPDLRAQILATPALQPRRAGRDSPIAAVALTNGDVDAVAGLLTLRESWPLALYATPRVLGVLAANSIFNVLNPDYVARRPLALGEGIDLATRDGAPLGLRVEVFSVPGKVALWLEDAAIEKRLAQRTEDTIGLAISAPATGKRFYYIPACAALDDDLRLRIREAPLLFFDGTLCHDDEMIAAGLGTKTGRRMGHLSVSGPAGSMAALASLGIGRKLFIHINNTNPILCAGTPERRAVEAAGWEVACDGLELRL
ncbi:MAG TPA: pyrroloquinoline quinone biosynthesis protein PqqB [Stellaceae bacterium]|nr:pyrroloquinoline quinone biosynthesis protein PqqB [Stellaceae bacterium]